MELSPTDQRDLLAPLYAGLAEQPPWREFLRRLLQRTGAERAGIHVRGPAEGKLDCWAQSVHLDPSVGLARETVGREFSALVRPNRVYALDEMLEGLPEAERPDAKAAFTATGLRFVRTMRVPGGQDLHAWLVLEHSRTDFVAADSALLSALAPHVTAALGLLRTVDSLRRRAEIAEAALGALGISQALLDRERHVVAADPASLGGLAPPPGGLLQVTGARATALVGAMAAVGQEQAPCAVIPDIDRAGRDLLLRPAPPSQAAVPLPGAVLAITRDPAHTATPQVAATLTALFGLSAREALLAAALADGAELVPAGLALGLTAQTTRNYSKRIYAKTGTRGQADLVRLVLSGIAPLAR